MDYVDVCPVVVIEQVRHADLSSAENNELFLWIEENADLECLTAAILGIADRLRSSSNSQVIDDFCNTVATYSENFGADDLLRVTAAYRRMKYVPEAALNYFGALRATGIDIRSRLSGHVAENWSFPHPRKDAATWHYYMYLASLGEAGALERLAQKVANTERGAFVLALLTSLADLKLDAVDGILEQYLDDKRLTEPPENDGVPIGVLVKMLIEDRRSED